MPFRHGCYVFPHHAQQDGKPARMRATRRMEEVPSRLSHHDTHHYSHFRHARTAEKGNTTMHTTRDSKRDNALKLATRSHPHVGRSACALRESPNQLHWCPHPPLPAPPRVASSPLIPLCFSGWTSREAHGQHRGDTGEAMAAHKRPFHRSSSYQDKKTRSLHVLHNHHSNRN
jgi:hypothetical protein